MTTVLHVLGATNAGKTTFLDQMSDLYPRGVRKVEIGKRLRLKYLDPGSPHFDPDKFKGQSNPKETAEEAWKLYLELTHEAVTEPGVEIVLVDGQPRDVEQARKVIELTGPGRRNEFALVHADHSVRLERLAIRFGVEWDPAFEEMATNDIIDDVSPTIGAGKASEFALGVRRMSSDYRGLYDVLAELAQVGIVPKVLNTSGMAHGDDGVQMVRAVCPTVWSMFNSEAL